MSSAVYSLQTIAVLHSCFKEKFGIPRQPGLASEAKAVLELLPPFNRVESIDGILHSSHLWLQFIFHASAAQGWQPSVRPPRLGGNERRRIDGHSAVSRVPVRTAGAGAGQRRRGGACRNCAAARFETERRAAIAVDGACFRASS